MLHRRSQAGARSHGSRSSDAEDAQLIERIRGGDLKAFEQLYRAFHPRLVRFLTSILRRPTLVEEALNDTMLVLWRRPEGFDGSCKVSTWIFAIAYRTALKALSRVDDPIDADDAAFGQSEEADPEMQMGQAQAQTALLRAINRLSAEHRAVVDLTYFHEVGYNEIARIMDCPVGTVKTRMFHARRQLRDLLAGRLTDWL